MRKTVRLFSIILLLLLGLSAIGGGGMLLYDKTGNVMEFPLDLLDKTPFNNYLIPGIVLFLCIGVFSIVIAFMVIKNIKNCSWLVALQGVILSIWLTAELIFNHDFFHPIYHIPLYVIAIYLILSGMYLKNNAIKKVKKR